MDEEFENFVVKISTMVDIPLEIVMPLFNNSKSDPIKAQEEFYNYAIQRARVPPVKPVPPPVSETYSVKTAGGCQSDRRL